MVNLATFDLNLLRVLDALLREGSTVRAGERLGLSQPAVSAALGRLRAALGDDLFVRVGQGLQPTDFAKGLEVELRQMLDQIGTLLSNVPFDPATSRDSFRISGADFFAELMMPALGARVSKLAPGMRLHLVDLVPTSDAASLERYMADIALVPGLKMPDWVETQRVFSSPYYVIARKDHPRLGRVAPGAVVPLDLYCDLGHVLFSPEGNPASVGDKALAAVGRSRQVVMTMPFFSGVYLAVAASDLIALLPGQLALHVAKRLPIDLYRPPVPVGPETLQMIWHRRQSQNPAHQWLRGHIAEILAPLDDQHLPEAP
ncbi:LysR family transcriptional regulator [Pararhodobacter sp. CCB-MM2]|uniref:LysR family transcriptional regulator n=1 Tax=Pararhodobacter sp. CCB-MM2 TaxID=1786003 RepID=UPI001F33777B|nr:LysR family transcriptional regulator [Pararhodobacter sp. CCB-MM2]